MILAVSATDIEMTPFLKAAHLPGEGWQSFVCGVGPVEAAVRLGRFLAEDGSKVKAILLFGVAGGYLLPDNDEQISLLTLCLASSEVLGDYGVCMADEIAYFPAELGSAEAVSFDPELLATASAILQKHQVSYKLGNFVTVNSASGTARRGEWLARRWQAICENMEGAAVSRIALEFSIPVLEVRAVSNHVVNRQAQQWQLHKAAAAAAEAAALLVKEMT